MPKCHGISLRCTECENVQPKPETNSDQPQFLRSRVLRSQCLRRTTVGTRRTLRGTSLERFSSSRGGFKLGKTHSTGKRTRRTQTYRNYDALAIQQWIRVKRLSVSRVVAKNNAADHFTKHLDGLRTQSPARKFVLRILDGTNGTNGDD